MKIILKDMKIGETITTYTYKRGEIKTTEITRVTEKTIQANNYDVFGAKIIRGFLEETYYEHWNKKAIYIYCVTTPKEALEREAEGLRLRIEDKKNFLKEAINEYDNLKEKIMGMK